MKPGASAGRMPANVSVSPAHSQADNALSESKEDRPGGEHQVRQREHAASAALVNRSTDRRPKDRREQQRTREDAKHHGRETPIPSAIGSARMAGG
jgi:hypothetical protein